ncbi:hypothetical protein EGH21_04580 [Halomicroarcula sp. F13]|uniref:Uncharacterized protein n=1 Tax=Haloarcula rubra TaxID=2487747 RepID=A0AAW4PMP8_9EURY|nr:hypothetical protein [Halomicroarcula rubra]MBX0322308.1 hypothetical protein [Halomicroarcula rubra]
MQTPPLEPGLVYVDQPDGRGAVAHVVRSAEATETLWVDAGGAASTYALTADGDRHALRGVRVARAFTAHQHHALVRRAVDVASGRTDLVVVPNVPALYEGADGPESEYDRLYGATCELLETLADALDVPVLVSAPTASDARRDRLHDRADTELTCRNTPFGYAVDAPGHTPPGYWRDGWWQTTVPYWVDVCGAVGDPGPTTADPVELVVD